MLRAEPSSVRLDGRSHPAAPTQTGVVDVKDQDLQPVGGCYGATFFLGVGGAGDVCVITIGGETGLSFSPAAGFGLEGEGHGGVAVFSNADSLEEFTGGSICGRASVNINGRGAASGAACDAIGSNVDTYYLGGTKLGARPVQGRAVYAYTELVTVRDVMNDLNEAGRQVEQGKNFIEGLLSGDLPPVRLWGSL